MKKSEKPSDAPLPRPRAERRTPFVSYSCEKGVRRVSPWQVRISCGDGRERYIARCPTREAARRTGRAFVAVREAAPRVHERAARRSARRLAEDAGVGQLHLPLADGWPKPDAL